MSDYWHTGPWKPPVFRPDGAKGPVGHFNPGCKHERTSYDILTCDACIAYTRQLEARRLAAQKAIDVKEIK